jgi:hypothetical protein
MDSVEVNGLRVAYRRAGSGRARCNAEVREFLRSVP